MALTLVQARKKVSALRKTINHHRFVYHTRDESEISDPAYDLLFRELEQLEHEFPELLTPDSPTQQIGSALLDKLPPAPHRTPMLSLMNAFSDEEVASFDKRVRTELGTEQVEYAVEPKIDGLALSLTYSRGSLTRAATRGDGTVGELVTNNVLQVDSVPKQLSGNDFPEHLEVRGELYIAKYDFQQFNDAQRESGKKIYANARNLAAGSIRQLETDAVAARPLKFLAYSVAESVGISFAKQSEALEWLKNRNMPVSAERNIAFGLSGLLSYYERIRRERDDLKYMIDGVVYKVNNLAEQSRLGQIARAPKFALAHKYPPERVVTKLLKINISVGRTGALTPVADLAPVHVGGVIVSSATLHNEEEVNRKRLREGKDVYVQRAGEVIPEVVEAVDKHELMESEKYRMPPTCPVCGSTVVRPEGESVARCMGGLFCRAQLKQSLLHFSSRRAMDIEGVGEKIIDVLVDEFGTKGPADLYQLDVLSLQWLKKTKPGATLEEAFRGSGSSDQEYRLFLDSMKDLNATSLENLLKLRDDGQLTERSVDHLRTLAVASIPKGGAKENAAVKRSRVGEKDAIRLLVQLERSKTRPLYRFIFALGIPHVGEEVAKILGRNFVTVEEFLAGKWGDLAEAKKRAAKKRKGVTPDPEDIQIQKSFRGAGPEIFAALDSFMREEDNVTEIHRLLSAGVRPLPSAITSVRTGPLQGKTFAFTGRFGTLNRTEAERQVETLGGEVLGAVSDRLDYLVVGDLADQKPSTKRDRAEKLNKPLLTEAAFTAMLRNPLSSKEEDDNEGPQRTADQ
jgi:DNA ligase (NAD+)